MILFLVASLIAAQPTTTSWTVGDLGISACTRMSDVQEAADADLVGQALHFVSATDMTGLLDMRPALEALVERHHDRGRAERCADVVWVNSGDANDALYLQADMVGSVTKSTASASRIEVVRNYIVDATAISAALAIDRADKDKAVHWLEIGVRVAPNDATLLGLRSLLNAPTSPGQALQVLRSKGRR